MPPSPSRGEVWLVDLGMAAKTRPCLVLNIPVGDADRALATLVPHTTSTRGPRFEVSLKVGFLRSGAFDAQNLVTTPTVKLLRRLGRGLRGMATACIAGTSGTSTVQVQLLSENG